MENQKNKRITTKEFLGKISEIMAEEKFYFATQKDVAKEIAKRYGGKSSAYLHRLRDMRINLKDFRS